MKQTDKQTEELLKNCNAYREARERCISQMKDIYKEKDSFCRKMIIKIIDNLDTNSEDFDTLFHLLKFVVEYWKK